MACDVRSYSPLALAFIGDGVYEMMVRERIVCGGNCSVKKLNAQKVKYVCCDAQAEAVTTIEPMLTEEEADVLRRGRNAHPGHIPKNADPAVYHMATALEALFGYLYLKGELARIRTLFEAISAHWA
ncbi:MAG: ribonuclease III [Clostridia bacterium]|nr:ribonuclease III [Clostridia bacterium]